MFSTLDRSYLFLTSLPHSLFRGLLVHASIRQNTSNSHFNHSIRQPSLATCLIGFRTGHVPVTVVATVAYSHQVTKSPSPIPPSIPPTKGKATVHQAPPTLAPPRPLFAQPQQGPILTSRGLIAGTSSASTDAARHSGSELVPTLIQQHPPNQ